ncbi:MAG: SH3 domain-containing protein [Candidatus Atribacteria bacterium]|nr:SH3 domain-containing protein [Candidatus Atribacteria bacterium]
MQTWIKIGLWILIVLGFTSILWLAPAWSPAAAQQPTGNIATVTGTASGPFITVTNPDGANVRAGPSSFDYAAIGFLVPGETAPALGKSLAGEWIEIIYLGAPGGVGWVYAPLVSLSPGSLSILEPPPTATPRTTPTINPTFAAAFQVQTTPTRLSTFTPPPPLATLNFEPAAGTRSRVPMGFVILGLALIGILGAVISFLRGR